MKKILAAALVLAAIPALTLLSGATQQEKWQKFRSKSATQLPISPF